MTTLRSCHTRRRAAFSAARAGAAEKLENMKKELGELLGARS
ncbi:MULTISPECIES: hypothetical protein [Dermabacter]|nr:MULTISPECIES: hypothetical protein [Dermabacter]